MRLVLTEFHLADYEINNCIHNFVYILCYIRRVNLENKTHLKELVTSCTVDNPVYAFSLNGLIILN